MDFRLLWKTTLSKPSDHVPVYSLCFKPDCSQLIVACSNDLFFIDPQTGNIVDQRRRPHYAPIYCVRCSDDGSFFASSSSDGCVVIWRSFNNEGFITYGSKSGAVRHLTWCPGKQMLISCTQKEYNIWKPDDSRASINHTKDDIQTIAFAPSGDTFIISYTNGLVTVLSTDKLEILQTFNYSSIVTALQFININSEDYLVTSDLDCRVSLFRASDKSLVGKNAIPFEALSCNTVRTSQSTEDDTKPFKDSSQNDDKPKPSTDSSFFFLFAGVSGKVSFLTSGLSYLGDFKTDSDWIWDTAVDDKGRVAIAAREGFVELRSIDFGLSFASSGDIVAYRTSLNAMLVRNVFTNECVELTYFRIIVSIEMSSRYLLVQFRDSIIVYRHERDAGEGPELSLTKVYEIPGNFEGSTFTISRESIISSDGAPQSTLRVFDLSGRPLCQFRFDSRINSLTSAPALHDGACVGCSDGRVFFVIFDQEQPILIARHDRPIIFSQRQSGLVALIDEDRNCAIYDTSTNQLLQRFPNTTSFSFSQHVEGLYAVSDGSSLTVHFYSCYSPSCFIEGQILGFVRNQIMLSKEGALEVIDAPLPLTQLIKESDWSSILKLSALGFTHDQISEIVNASIHAKRLDVAMVLAPRVSRDLASFVADLSLVLNKNDAEYDALVAARENPKIPSSPEKTEETESPEDSFELAVSEGRWKDALNIAEVHGLERRLASLDIPSEEAEGAARVLLKAGLGDSAVRVLTKADDVSGLAKARVYLGQWYEAISLSRLYSNVYGIVYPRFGELLFESGRWFEALVCFFIPRERDERLNPLQKLEQASADACATDQLSFIRLMIGFAEPEGFWRAQAEAIAYLAAERLKRFVMMPLTPDEAETVFCLAYYLLAIVRAHPMRGLQLREALVMLLTAAADLGLKRWVHYALAELSGFSLTDPLKQLIQMHVHEANSKTPALSCPCPRCGKDIYGTGRAPSLVCFSCGARLAFSGYSCRPLQLTGFDVEGSGDDIGVLCDEDAAEDEETQPRDIEDEEYVRKTPPEALIIQKLKKKAGVGLRIWYNGKRDNVHMCRCCGLMLNELDYERSVLENDMCPLCRNPCFSCGKNMNVEVKSEILEMLRSFEEDSPVYY